MTIKKYSLLTSCVAMSLRKLTFNWSREIPREQRDEVLHRLTGANWGDRDSKLNEVSGMPVTYCWVPLPSALCEHYASTSICDMAFLIDVPGWKTGQHTGPAVGIPGPLAILSRDIWKRTWLDSGWWKSRKRRKQWMPQLSWTNIQVWFHGDSGQFLKCTVE